MAAKLQAKRDSDPAGFERPDPAHQKPGEKKLPVVGRRSGLQVVIGPEESREYVLTNKEKAYFAGETGTTNTRSYEGLIVELHKFLEGWDLFLGEKPLSAYGVKNACVLPQSMTREHIVEQTVETVFLSDAENILILTYGMSYRGRAAFVPRIDIRSIWEEGKPEYHVHWDAKRSVLALRRTDHARRTKDEDYPVWVAIACDRAVKFVPGPGYRHTVYTKDAARRAMGSAVPYTPGRIEFDLAGDDSFAANVTMSVAVGDELEETIGLARRGIDEEFALYNLKMRRISDVLDGLGVAAHDNDYRLALQWAAASVDGLIMNQMGRGIFAGLHWFPNYWGRDTFISLPGACLVRGEFGVAREIIETFARLLETAKESPFYGRVPNLVMPGRVYYNTADGTLWFVREIYEYLRYTGDRDFAARILPTVETAIEAVLERRVDPAFFVTHGEAETWMDAGGDERPYSPRGNRAVEIEALWYTALRSGAGIARAAGRGDAALRWDGFAEKVRTAFGQAFWDEERAGLYDHLNPDGTPDRQVRPNQILAVTVPWDDLVPRERSEAVVRLVAETCVLPHGVASLDPRDPNFHPRHLDLERYHFDEAYHNGDVWTWLTGPVVSGLVKHGFVGRAWEQTTVLKNLIFDEGAAGTLPELRNGVPPASGENVTGAVSQAWSLAEFLRNFQQDYLGVAPDLLDGTLDLRPVMPQGLSWMAAPVRLGAGSIFLFYEVAEDRTRARYRVTADAALPTLRVRFEGRVPLGADLAPDVVRAEAALERGESLEFVVDKGRAGWSARTSTASHPSTPRSDRS